MTCSCAASLIFNFRNYLFQCGLQSYSAGYSVVCDLLLAIFGLEACDVICLLRYVVVP